MKLLSFIALVVLCLNLVDADNDVKKVVKGPVVKEVKDLNKGKREAALHPYSYGPPKHGPSFHGPSFSNSLHLGGGFSLSGPKFSGHSSGGHYSYSPPSFPLFTPHSSHTPSFSGPVYSAPVHFSGHSSSGHNPRYTSISGVYKPSIKHTPTHSYAGPQTFGPNHLVKPQPSISQPSSVYGFSSPTPSLQHYTDTKGLSSYASQSIGAILSHGSSPTFYVPSGSYGPPSFGSSHGSHHSSSFSLGGSIGGHGSSHSSNPFAGFFDTHSKPSHSHGGSSSSSTFKPSAFLGSSISAPSSTYGSPSLSSHSSIPSGSYGPSTFSSHGPSLSNTYGTPTFSSHSSPSSSYEAPSGKGIESSHGSFSSGSLFGQSLPSSHSPLPFTISESDKAKLLSGVPIYITGNDIGGHSSEFGSTSSHHGIHGSPSLSGSYEIPSAGHAAPAISFSHLLGSPVTPSSSYGAPSHESSFSSSLSHEAPSSSYGAPSHGYATHEAPQESYDHSSEGKGFVTGFSTSVTHGASNSHGSPSFSTGHASSSFGTGHESPSFSTGHGSPSFGTSHGSQSFSTSHGSPSFSTSHGAPSFSTSHGSSSFSTGHDFSGSSDNSFNSINSGKLELPSPKSPQLFSSPDHGSIAPSSSYLPSKSYSPPSSSYGVPHDTYGPPKAPFIINVDSHDDSSDKTYNTIKYSRSLPVDEKPKKTTT